MEYSGAGSLLYFSRSICRSKKQVGREINDHTYGLDFGNTYVCESVLAVEGNLDLLEFGWQKEYHEFWEALQTPDLIAQYDEYVNHIYSSDQTSVGQYQIINGKLSLKALTVPDGAVKNIGVKRNTSSKQQQGKKRTKGWVFGV